MLYTIKPVPTKEVYEELKEFDPIIQRMLYNRGILTKKEAYTFTNPEYYIEEYNPLKIPGVEVARDRVIKALNNNECIGLYSDFDCDGIPAAATMFSFLKKVKHNNVAYFVPVRNNDGYGFHKRGIDELSEMGATLIIVMDCGTNDVEAINYAREKEIDVIIIDHHEETKKGEPFCLINLKIDQGEYHTSLLCGAGCTFKLVQSLCAHEEVDVPEDWEKWLLDVVGIATIADNVPLIYENRSLAHYGLLVLRKTKNVGLKSLLSFQRIKHINEDTVAFSIAPFINAASRMGDAKTAFNLLTSETYSKAKPYLDTLIELKKKRRVTTTNMIRQANKMLETKDKDRAIWVLGDPTWKPSLAGLVAIRLSELYNKIIFIWGRSENMKLVGSCRGNGTVNIVELMGSLDAGVFERFGGHAQAGGFTLSYNAVHSLEDDLNKYPIIKEAKKDFLVDCEVKLEDVNDELYNKIRPLAPFGVGNPQPVFVIKDIFVKHSKFGAGGAHTKYVFSDEGTTVNGIKFFNKEIVPQDSRCTVLCSIDWDDYSNSSRIGVIELLVE